MAQFIYADEAGNDDNSPVTVVAGIIVDADRKLFDLERAIREELRSLPPALDGVALSAKMIWGDRSIRDHWPSMTSRKRFIERMLSLPRRLRVPIAYSIIRRDRTFVPNSDALSPVQVDHVLALAQFATHADRYIRNHCSPSEVGMIFYEDMPDFREKIRDAINVFRDRENHIELTDQQVNWSADEVAQGYNTQYTDFRVDRIRQTVAFVKKADDPLTILSDFVAFCFRRYFSDGEHSEDFMQAMIEQCPDKSVWARPSSGGVFYSQD